MKKTIISLMLLGLLITSLSAIEVNLTGSVISDNQKMLTSRYMGYIKNMAVSEGDIVKKGQLLYEIDSTEIESSERQVNLAISQANISLQMNKNQYKHQYKGSKGQGKGSGKGQGSGEGQGDKSMQQKRNQSQNMVRDY